jgi:hypothetical protein
LERLETRADSIGNSTKRSINAGDLNLPYADWNGKVECTTGGGGGKNL